MENILKEVSIKTGSNISALLQTTVNIPQAFTELVKNSIQNLATVIEIEISEEEIVVRDNGRGFDHKEDFSGKNDFDRYFIFGNSYDNSRGQGVRLGHMGIGGKLANDKLCEKIDWSIYTKNKDERSFKVDYRPIKSEFLDDYKPKVVEIPYDKEYIAFETGTAIVIKDVCMGVRGRQKETMNMIEREIKSFFGVLINEYNREEPVKLYINGRDISFDYKIPGLPFLKKTVAFEYVDGDGETKESEIKFNISKVNDMKELKDSNVKSLDIISDVKICTFNLDNKEIIKDLYEKISKSERDEISIEAQVLHKFNNLVGFIVCQDLSKVLDKTGMPAKDISHHYLRDDHFITKPFLEKVYEQIIAELRINLGIDEKSRRSQFNDMAKDILSILAGEHNIEVDTISEDDENPKMGVEVGEENEHTIEIETNAIDQSVFDEEGIYDYVDESKLPKDMPSYIDPRILPEEVFRDDFVEINEDEENNETNVDKEIKEDSIVYDIINFGEGYETEMSSSYSYGKLIITINSGNFKFKKVEDLNNRTVMASHIADCMIKEIELYKNPGMDSKTLDTCISFFYEKYGEVIKEKFS
jgi:hypothetical protein